MTNEITLYDIPDKNASHSCWSLHVWKTRLALNAKGIDYKTHWLEYPEIEPTLKSFGLAPQEGQFKPYTVPAIYFPGDDGGYFMNSRVIIVELERRFPTPEWPSLHLEDPAVDRSYELIKGIAEFIWPLVVPNVPKNILSEKSLDYFYSTRKEEIGMTLDEYGATVDREEAWEKSKPAFDKVVTALKEKGGPFFLGETVSYADFIVAGFLQFVRRAIGEDEFKRVEAWPQIIALQHACGKWLQGDS
ncbi:hypothetical protein NM208_g3462 [Fusarium decemcellulare]|uniref:Uncharacterized protein n=1 Tax=Fusarium decemcellulare TaxID=57161 RepID=A0ACC1SPI6_9HYPO|nr:hypothetical protein NM208_g3462 [Fusarium decemcellulare]